MAEQVCSRDDLPAADVLDLLAALADKSLVVVDSGVNGQTRYRMLDSIREYAAARLDAAGEAAMLQQRLRDYAMLETEHLMQMGMGLIQAPWPVTVQTFRRFDSDLGNLRQVLGRCLADRDVEAGLRLCTVMGPVWIVRGSSAEGAEWYDSFFGLDRPAAPVPAAVLGPAIVGRAQLALASDPVQAQVRAAEGLGLCREAGADFWTATALNLLTEVALHAGRGGEAADRADETLAVARQAGDRWNEGYALGTMAAAAGQRGDLAAAQRLGEAALAVMRGIDQQWGVARTLLGLGDLARLTGDAHAARRRYEEALAILREVNARPEIARCLAGLHRPTLGRRRPHPSAGIAAWLEYSLLRRSMHQRIGVVDYPASRVLRLWLAAIVASLLCYLLHRHLPIHSSGARAAILTAIAVLIPYGALYLAFTMMLKVPIPGSLLRRFKRG